MMEDKQAIGTSVYLITMRSELCSTKLFRQRVSSRSRKNPEM
jgi:hypothetical protein